MGTPSDVSCNGGSNGSATVTVSGGTSPYTYSWAPSGGTSATATGLAAGTYTVTITDAKSCTTTKTVTITQPATALSAIIGSSTNIACNGSSTGSATVTASGGSSPYTYSWAPSGGTGATATGLASGTYTVSVTDSKSCATTQTVTITEPAAITAIMGTPTNVSCKGGSNGSATVTASGGTGTLTYSWAPSGGTSASATGLAAGNYTVTITDANACTKTQTVSITEPAALTATIATPTNVSCNGGSNGSATVTPTGGTSPYTYSWSPSGGSAATASGLSAGDYTVTVTDNKGCTTTATVSITQPTALSATMNTPTPASCNGGSNGSAMVTAAGGTSPYTYTWAPSGGTAATANGLGAGTYTVTVKDTKNCTATATVTITEPTAIVAAMGTPTPVSCNGGNDGAASVTVSGGTAPYTYSWAPSGGTAAAANGLSAGTYTVTVKDNNNCTKTATVSITAPTALTATIGTPTPVSCNGGKNGSATVTVSGGTAPYTYSWAPSGGTAATANGLSADTYTVTVKDNNNCTTTATVTITEPAALATTMGTPTPVSCNGGSNGSVHVAVTGGTAPYIYSWAPSGGSAATATGLMAGTYTVTVTDNKGCTIIDSATIKQPDALIASIKAVHISCKGKSDGSATVTATGGTFPYTYSWAPSGGTGATATGLAPGTYTATVTDANSCTTTQTVSITEPDVLTATSVKKNVLCHGDSTGMAAVIPSGGTAPYTYSWNPYTDKDSVITMVKAGTYTCTITDAHSCTYQEVITITQPNALTATITHTDLLCAGATNGSATVSVSGGTGTYTYNWAPNGGMASTANGLAAGTYTVTVKDSNACVLTQTVTIIQPAPITVKVVKTDILCHGDSTGSAAVVPTGGVPPYAYSWNIPSKDSVIKNLPAGVYTCSITDANNCKHDEIIKISEPDSLVATIAHTNITCFSEQNGAATALPKGGSGSYKYLWTPGGATTATISNLAMGTYTVNITDSLGCSITRTVMITMPAKLLVSANATPIECHGKLSTVTIAATGGTPPYKGIGTFTKPAGAYTFIIADTNSCMDSVKLNITEPAEIKTSQSFLICSGNKVIVGDSTYTHTGIYTNVLLNAHGCDSIVVTNLTVKTPVNTNVTVNGHVLTAQAINSIYQWIDCNNSNTPIAGEVGQSYTATKDGSYAVIVKTDDCSDTSACYPVIISGISTNTITEAFTVYPNPNNGMCTIHSTMAGTYTIVNTLGQTVRSFQLNSSNNYTVTISELNNGTYYIIGISNHHLTKQKMVVLEY
jgi:hypothetical protein